MKFLKKILEKNNIKSLTKIQEKAIPIISENTNCLVISQTGSGKTLVFVITLLNTYIENNSTKALVITPTRELCYQVFETFKIFQKDLKFSLVCITGGEEIWEQKRMLDDNHNFIISTPGRLVQHLQNGFMLENIKFLILDEVDKLLEINFEKDLEYIESKINKNRKNIFLSATYNKIIDEYIKKRQIVMINIKQDEDAVVPNSITHKFLLVPLKYKELYLIHALKYFEDLSVLVFFSSCHKVNLFFKILNFMNIKTSKLHGRMKQKERYDSLCEFNHTKKIFATDLASRGLNLKVDIVINYDQPQNTNIYIHRVGRTGRSGKKGSVLNIVTQKDFYRIIELEKDISVAFEKIIFEKNNVLINDRKFQEAKIHAKT